MTVTISITDDDVFTALGNFLVSVLPTGTEVIQLQDNGVAMPSGPFVGMNNGNMKRLATNTDTYNDPVTTLGTKLIGSPSAYTMTVDLYGPDSGAWAATVQALFRDEYVTSLFPDNIQPLYADDPIQIPLINGEQQWEQRWRLQAVMQTSSVVTVPQDFAASLSVSLKEVEAEYH